MEESVSGELKGELRKANGLSASNVSKAENLTRCTGRVRQLLSVSRTRGGDILEPGRGDAARRERVASRTRIDCVDWPGKCAQFSVGEEATLKG